jgi:hypothetical protein
VQPVCRHAGSARKERHDLLGKALDPVGEVGARVTEVEDEAVAARVDVLLQALGDPFRRAGDCMSSTFVPRGLGVGRDVDTDAQDDATVRSPLTELGRHRAQLVRGKRDRVPHACQLRPPESRAGHAGHPQLRPACTDERRRHPPVERGRSCHADVAGHLLEHGGSESQPLVEELAASLVLGLEGCELCFHPTRGDGGHDTAAGEKVERRELLQRDERLPLRDHERRNAELESSRSAGEEAERHERFCDRSVRAGLVGGDEQVIRDPAGIEARLFCDDGHVDEPLGVERLAVVGQDHAKMEPRHTHTLATAHARTAEGDAMKAKDWIDAYAEQLGTDPPTADELRAILELAAEAAHASERIAAPVACWLGAKSGRSLDESLALARGLTP